MNKKSCRVGVIGGGLSGLTIATALQKKGYFNVTVLERENRVGGKLYTIWYKGKSYELGAIFGLPVQSNLRALMKECNVKNDGPNMSRVSYDTSGRKIMPIPKKMLGRFLEEIDRLPEVLEEYSSLKRTNISNIEESLMLTFFKWCDLHNFKVLKTIYTHHFTSYGLGDIEIMPALYVLRVLTYDTVMSFMEVPEYLTWKSGVSSLINSLSEEIKDLRLGQGVTSFSVKAEGRIKVQTSFEDFDFDKIIIAAPLEQFAESFKDDDMKNFLGKINYQRYNVYQFSVENLPKGSGCILENLSMERKGHVVIWNARWDSSTDDNLLTVYAYNHANKSKAEQLEIIKNDLLKLGIKNPRLHIFKSWNQYPYVDCESLKKGFYDKMENMQGKNNIFLAGEIMSSVIMENCIRYSNYLINKYF